MWRGYILRLLPTNYARAHTYQRLMLVAKTQMLPTDDKKTYQQAKYKHYQISKAKSQAVQAKRWQWFISIDK